MRLEWIGVMIIGLFPEGQVFSSFVVFALEKGHSHPLQFAMVC